MEIEQLNLKALKPTLLLSILVMSFALLTFACNEHNGVELPTTVQVPPPPVEVPPPVPPAGNLAGSWKGTYETNDSIDCDPSILLIATATFVQKGNIVKGTIAAKGFCGLDYSFQGNLQGNSLYGKLFYKGSPFGSASGTLSGKTLAILPANSYGWNMGTMHLHR